MVYLRDVIEKLNLEMAAGPIDPERPVEAGYAADLLSCAMNNAKKDYLWITLQAHVNVVAVASLLGLAGVIITEGNRPDPDTTARADGEGVTLLLTPKTTFAIVCELAALGVRAEPGQR